MLAFVTSLRSKALADNWDHHVRLLERMVASCLAQTDADVRVIVVCHERPALSLADPRLSIVEVDFPLPRREFNDMTVDKVLKISLGAERAIAAGARFLMFADADDLVSRRLAAHAAAHPGANGWYFTTGYVHRYGRPWLTLNRDHHLLCGTCAVVRADLLEFGADAAYRGGRVNTLAAIGHNLYAGFMRERGHALEPLSFPGSVYIQHGESTVTELSPAAADLTVRGRLRRLRRAVRRLRDVRLLTPALAREFTIERVA